MDSCSLLNFSCKRQVKGSTPGKFQTSINQEFLRVRENLRYQKKHRKMFQACAQKVSKTPIFKEVIDVLVISAVYYSLILQVTTTPQNFEFKLLQKESSK